MRNVPYLHEKLNKNVLVVSHKKFLRFLCERGIRVVSYQHHFTQLATWFFIFQNTLYKCSYSLYYNLSNTIARLLSWSFIWSLLLWTWNSHCYIFHKVMLLSNMYFALCQNINLFQQGYYQYGYLWYFFTRPTYHYYQSVVWSKDKTPRKWPIWLFRLVNL